jgi:hypothetical protein
MTSLARLWVAAAVTLAAPLVRLAAQRPAATQQQVDSLAAQLRRLQARFDSVLAVLAKLQAAGHADTSLAAARADSAAAQDDLAALRARARAAVPEAAADTGGQRGTGRERNLNQLNPEVSATGNLGVFAQTEGPQQDNFGLHELELSFQAALDPYSHTKIFLAVGEGVIDVEEAYFYYTGLPGRLRLDLGRFRQQLGELNRWHLHAVPETDYPLVLTTYAGEEGLIGTGLSTYWAGSILGTQELWAQFTIGDNEGLFDGGNRPAVLGHLNNFWQLGRSTYMQIGATAAYGTNPDTVLKSTLAGLDFRFTWRPPARAKYREWTVRGEVYAINKERAGVGDTRIGWYAGTQYKLGARWLAGVRYDYVEAPEGPNDVVRQVIPSLTFWQSEFVRLHAEWRHTRDVSGKTNVVALQAVWAIGPHKHETY